MKMKDKEQIIFTPGLDSRSLKMDYYDIDNMVIVGTSGSGKTTALNAIVKSMIESNNSEYLQLVMFDGSNNVNESPFFSTSRITPFTQLQSYLGFCPKMFYHEVFSLLQTLNIVVTCINGDLGEEPSFGLREGKLIPGKIVVVINEFEALPLYLQYLTRMILGWGSSQVKFILTGQSERPFKDFIQNIRYRLTTRVEDKTSNLLLGCNIGSRRADKYGTCWFYDINEPDTYTKHIVNFVPESLLNRMMKTYASGKEPNNKLLSKYHAAAAVDSRYLNNIQVMSEIYKIDAQALFEDFLNIANKEV